MGHFPIMLTCFVALTLLDVPGLVSGAPIGHVDITSPHDALGPFVLHRRAPPNDWTPHSRQSAAKSKTRGYPQSTTVTENPLPKLHHGPTTFSRYKPEANSPQGPSNKPSDPSQHPHKATLLPPPQYNAHAHPVGAAHNSWPDRIAREMNELGCTPGFFSSDFVECLTEDGLPATSVSKSMAVKIQRSALALAAQYIYHLNLPDKPRGLCLNPRELYFVCSRASAVAFGLSYRLPKDWKKLATAVDEEPSAIKWNTGENLEQWTACLALILNDWPKKLARSDFRFYGAFVRNVEAGLDIGQAWAMAAGQLPPNIPMPKSGASLDRDGLCPNVRAGPQQTDHVQPSESAASGEAPAESSHQDARQSVRQPADRAESPDAWERQLADGHTRLERQKAEEEARERAEARSREQKAREQAEARAREQKAREEAEARAHEQKAREEAEAKAREQDGARARERAKTQAQQGAESSDPTRNRSPQSTPPVESGRRVDDPTHRPTKLRPAPGGDTLKDRLQLRERYSQEAEKKEEKLKVGQIWRFRRSETPAEKQKRLKAARDEYDMMLQQARKDMAPGSWDNQKGMFDFTTIPWPVLRPQKYIAPRDVTIENVKQFFRSEGTRQCARRSALLFHPDKLNTWTSYVAEAQREEVRGWANQVVVAINEALAELPSSYYAC